MDDLTKKDYLEIYDMDKDELMKYKKSELIDLIGALTGELYDKEHDNG